MTGTSDDLKDFLTQEPPDPAETPLAPGQIIRASELLEAEEDAGDFGPGNLYKGFAILPEPPLDAPEAHGRYLNGFYVVSPRGMLGFVPWPGSVVVWETEAGWVQDLARAKVDTFLRPEGKKKR